MTAKQPRIDLNPSSADRWTTCTASPQFIMDNWDKVPSSITKYNQEGTTAHEVAASLLQNREPNLENCPHLPIDEDMWQHGWNYMEYVEALREPGSTLLVEQKLPLWYMPGRNAIVDAGILNPQSLHIVDFKYGAGVVVSPDRSLQATIYAKSLVEAKGFSVADDFPVFIHIYQPRGRAAEHGASHIWETTWGEIQEVARDITFAAELIQGKRPVPVEFKPSEKGCQWCPAKRFCTARQTELTQGIKPLAKLDKKQIALPATNTISIEQFSAILQHKDEIVKWLNDAEEYATDFMKSGGEIPGFKLVMSRGGNRYWSDPKKAAELLTTTTILKRNEVVEEKTIGPAAVEKLLGKNKMNSELMELITKAPGSPVIAPESDKREPFALVDAKQEFEPITENQTTN